MSLGEDITYKIAKVENFTIFLDYEIDSEDKAHAIMMNEQKQETSNNAINLNKLFQDTTNKVYFQIIKDEFEDTTIKHHYIIDKFGMEARLKINKNPLENHAPQIDIDLLLGGKFQQQDENSQDICVHLNVHQPQIIRVLKLLEYIGYYNQFQQGALINFQNKEIKQDIADEYIKQYCEWRMLKDNKKAIKETEVKRDKLKEIEFDYPADKMIILRKFANKIVEQQIERKRNEEEIGKKVSQLKSEKIGWGLLISKQKKAEEEQAIQEFKAKLEQELYEKMELQKSELDQELQVLTQDLSSQKTITSEDFDKMPEGYIRFTFQLNIPSLKFSFANEFEQSLFVAEIQGQYASIQIGKGVTRVLFQVYSLLLEDNWTGASAFPKIIETKELTTEGQVIADNEQKTAKKQAFIFKMENNAAFMVSPFKISIITEKTLFIVANFYFIKEAQRSMQGALQGEQLDFSFYTEAATEKALTYMNTGKELIDTIKKGEFKHSALDISLFMTAPVILIPENVFKPANPCLVIDAGSIKLESFLAAYNKEIDYKLITTPSSLYDKYETTLSNFEINILTTGLPNGLSSFKKSMGLQIIKKFTSKIYFFNCVEPMHPQFPTGELSIVIENFELLFSPQMFTNILRIQGAVVEQLDTKEQQIFKKVTLEKKPSLQEMMGDQLSKKIKEAQELAIEQEGSEKNSFFLQLQQNVEEDNEKMKLEKKQSEKSEEKNQEEENKKENALSTSLKVFFSVEKFQVILQQEILNTMNQITDMEDIINILMLNFGVEVEIDRNKNTHVNVSIFKFLIEDVHDIKIAKPFRVKQLILKLQMILSSPLVEEQNIEIQQAKYSTSQSILRNSFVTIIKYKAQEDSDDEFKDALESEQPESPKNEPPLMNEFQLAVLIQDETIDVNCILSDLRFVFAVPTAQKLATIGLNALDILKKQEQIKLQERKEKIQLYTDVLSKLNSNFEADEKTLANKVFVNMARENDIDIQFGQIVYEEGIQRLSNLWQVEEQIKKEDELSNESVFLERQGSWAIQQRKKKGTLRELTKETKSKVNVSARLNNFSIWIPMYADSTETQIFSLSFMSDFRMNSDSKSLNKIEATLGEVIKSKPIEQNTSIRFFISHFVIQTTTLNDFMKMRQAQKESEFQDAADIDMYSTSKILAPCRISLSMDTITRNRENISKNTINLKIEPMHIQVGFKHVDFANIVMHQILGILDYINKLNKEIEQSQLEEEKVQEEVDIYGFKEPQEKQGSKISVKSYKFEPYRKYRKSPTTIQSIIVSLETLTLSLQDDTEVSERQLLYTEFENVQFVMKSYDQEDDAATYMLKKLGIWKKQHPKEAREQMYKDMSAFAQLKINYYNQRSFAFEPLLEPYKIKMTLHQHASYTQQNIQLDSPMLLNVNITFGMELAVRKIMDRVNQSSKQAEILQKIEENQKVSSEELKKSQIWKERLLSNEIRSTSKGLSYQAGFIFQNYTGLELKAALHDDLADEELDTQFDEEQKSDNLLVGKISKSILKDTNYIQFTQQNMDQPIFKSYSDLHSAQKQINIRKTKGHDLETIEEDPLRMDFKFNGLDKIDAIPIEGVGIYGYQAAITQNSPLQKQEVDKQGMQPKGNIMKLGLFRKKSAIERTIGIIVNIKMEGYQQKSISLESQLLITNNLKRPLNIFIKTMNEQDYEVPNNHKALLQSESTFRVPLVWMFEDKQYSLYIETKTGSQLLFKNLDEIYTGKLQNSKLYAQGTQVVNLETGFFTSVDVAAYSCLPRSQVDVPPQYVVSFNSPIMINNYNFQPLEIKDSRQNLSIAKIGPKETAYLTTIDGYTQKPNLDWIFHESLNKQLYLTSMNFDLQSRLNGPTIEKFTNKASSNKDLRAVKVVLEVKKAFYQNSYNYEENFELRQRIQDVTSSCQIMLYPKYMLINKTSMPFICRNQTFLPYTNEYLNTSENKVSFKIPGYKYSEDIDVSTIGLSGAISLDLDSVQDVIKERLPTRAYIPEKLEFGLTIQSAPVPYNKTVLITILPRYLFVNQLGTPLVIKQKGVRSQVLARDQISAYNFESRKERSILVRQPMKDEMFAISQGKTVFEDLADDEQRFWTSPFSIDDVEDFQVCYPKQQAKGTEDKWYEPSPENNYQRFIRVIITSQNEATILVVFTNPAFPEYQISNKTDMVVEYAQLQEDNILSQMTKRMQSQEDMIIGNFGKLQPKVQIPFAWPYRINSNRRLAIRIGNTLEEINIDKAMKKTQLTLSNNKKLSVEIRVSGNAKVVKIESEKDFDINNQALFLQNLMKRYQGSQLNLNVNIKGVGLSFIDDKPQELLYFSLYDLKLQMQKWIEPREDKSGTFETVTMIKLSLKHLQLDNMINQIMPVVLAPTKPLQRQDQEGALIGIKPLLEESQTQEMQQNIKMEDEDIPFIQTIISISESQGTKDKMPVKRLRALQFAIQEFVFQCETSIINSNLKFVLELIQTFNDEKTNLVYLANVDNFDKFKQQKREEVCDALDASKPIVENTDIIQANKMFIELIHLGAIKAIVTFKLEKKAVEFDVSDPRRGFGAFNFLYSLLAGVVSISNSPLTFKELVLLDTFTSQNLLIEQITKNYARQGAMQFYKLIGSSDLIGNPMGLFNKLGTGCKEFFSEPAKGLLKGPDEFVGGVGKGVQSLVSNVFSGGFDSVSKITGSLYTVMKNVSGEKNVQIEKTEHIGQGIYKGVKGGVSELVGGITGLVTKPIEKTKQEGAKGFFKGFGSGLVGAITAPVTATLRVGSTFTQGVAASATAIGNYGKITFDTNSLYSRFRPPRYINTKNVITTFDEDMALVSQIFASIYDGRYSQQTIKYFVMLPETKHNGEIANREANSSIIFITDAMLIYLKIEKEGQNKGKPTPLFKSRLMKVKKVEVYRSPAGDQNYEPYVMYVKCYSQMKGEKSHKFQTRDFEKFEKLYNLLSILPQCEAEDKVRNVKSKATKMLFDCCI